MDAFETVVAAILQRQGYWTLTSVKVGLTKEEKREIGRHSSPRWELDVVAYRGRDNSIKVVECKSFRTHLEWIPARSTDQIRRQRKSTSCFVRPRYAGSSCVG